ncbi:MAG: T9SS type A sorting domain-containing protein [Cytophagales bacterium]|nr:T9SS type A sorting domain-containing protein [Cytophagales bacterium]
MKFRTILTTLSLLLCLTTFDTFGQRYARANGFWGDAIWASTPNGVAGSASVPTATDDAYTNGFQVTVNTSGRTCRNLFVSFNVANSLTINNPQTLTVTGTLNGWDDVNGFEELPVLSNILVFVGSGSRITFTGANIQPAYEPYPIFFWDNTVPLGRVNFNLGSLSLNILIPLSISQVLQVSSGTLTADPGASLSGNSTASLTISSGASFVSNDALSNFNSVTISGTLQTAGPLTASGASGAMSVGVGGVVNSTGSAAPITANSLTLGGSITTSNALNVTGTLQINSGGVLNTSFAGTQGWWSTSAPSSLTLDANSTINYSGGNQNIASTSYGNLTLSGSGTKTVTGGGSVNVAGNLLFGNAGVTLNSANQLIFNGLSAQSISGGGTANLNGGLQINKTGTLALSQNISVQSGLTITSGTLDLGSNTLSLSGNLSNSGTLIASASTLNITGSSSFSGAVLTLNNLTISGTGSLTAPATLNIAGNFTNNGSFNANGGVLIFNGSAPQTIGGSTVTSFYDVTTSNAVSLTSQQNLTGILTVSSNTFTTNNNLTLVSTASSDAMIGNSAGTVSGNVTVQKYLNNTVKSYRYLSSPVVGATAAAWKSSFPITGTFNDPSTQGEWPGIPGIVQASPSMYSYNEPAGGALGARFASFPANGTSTSGATLVSGTGYAAFIRQTSPITLSVNGTVRQGTNVQINLTNTSGDPTDDGWNLIGNPFPAPLNWSTVTIPPNVSGTMSLKDNNGILVSSGSYVTCSGGACTPGSYNGIIPIGQAFWVRRTAVGTGPITFSESNKSTTRNPTFLRTETIANLLRAKLSGNGREDELVVRLATGASDAADNKFDGFKLNNDFLNFYSVSIDGQKLAINGAAPLTAEQSIKSFPLRIEGNGNWVVSPGSYRISITEIESFDSGIEIYLKDAYLKDSLMVSQNFEYNFSTVTDPKSYKDRFSLIIGRPSVTTAASDDSANGITKIYPNPTNGEFTIETEQSADKTASILNSVGQRIGKVDLTPSEKWLVGTWDLATQPEGVYFVQIVNGKKVQTKKIVKK